MPIVAGVVAPYDVPIYLTGVGTVIADNTVTIRSQNHGQIVSINFTEGHADAAPPAQCAAKKLAKAVRL
jgi:multidrug efflux pump subunit AcrA (membrane-fusion protein)